MKTVGVRELKKNLSEALREVEAGEIIEVTNRGRVIARVVPVRSQKHNIDAVRVALADIEALAAKIAAYWPESVSAAEALDDVRGNH